MSGPSGPIGRAEDIGGPEVLGSRQDRFHGNDNGEVQAKAHRIHVVSIDGVIGDLLTWAAGYFDKDAQAGALNELLASDGMLMGRGSCEYFAPAWPHVPGDYAARMNEMPQYVFSNTLETAEWSNSTIVRGDVPSAVRDLKQPNGQDLMIYVTVSSPRPCRARTCSMNSDSSSTHESSARRDCSSERGRTPPSILFGRTPSPLVWS